MKALLCRTGMAFLSPLYLLIFLVFIVETVASVCTVDIEKNTCHPEIHLYRFGQTIQYQHTGIKQQQSDGHGIKIALMDMIQLLQQQTFHY